MFYNVRRSQAVLKVHGIVLCAIMRAREVLSLGLYAFIYCELDLVFYMYFSCIIVKLIVIVWLFVLTLHI